MVERYSSDEAGQEWSSGSMSESVALLGDLIDSGVSVYVLNELWKESQQESEVFAGEPLGLSRVRCIF